MYNHTGYICAAIRGYIKYLPASKDNERKVTLNPARHCQRCQHCSSGASQALAGWGEL
ncbi:MAG: hypothetical protein JRF30_05635 [Deltaproteobacteria bacterium]|nr:hypothetical protein [Deltaproteobacteria bacterium]MBW1794336.1 hypothetical protein [Deltaproteobacteria bacterium]MBW2330404.1 hypothetical protein [Deltaproteobacteria bacterium]